MNDWHVIVVSEPGGSSAADNALDRFSAELQNHLSVPVELIEQPLTSIEIAPRGFLLLRAHNLGAALARVHATGTQARTIALDVSRVGTGEFLERHSLAGAIPTPTYREWQHWKNRATGRGLWARLDLAEQLGASVIGEQATARYGQLEGPYETLPALVAAYLTASARALVPATSPAASAGRPASEEDIQFALLRLTAGTAMQRALVLQNLASRPLHDARVTEAISALLKDRAACLLSIPLRVGELRWLAATALVAQRYAAGNPTAIQLTCVPPQTTDDLATGLERLNLPWPKGEPIDAAIAAFEQLRALNALHERTIEMS